ncbi:LOB domain-containing protein 27 [Beta vulgaris subsp. vulgaris]|uniref:LOB domain-containing protein 27 n=1 Tax=Beta vulgaris subsp. vulgaris TaxID=3555 RepID=UPI002547B62C|nr:LOB domain-containing protein 27 [Beta vulgaris subsp. vulgaris]
MMTIKGGASQACAACKYQRRRCAPNCVLAPYFPADKPKMFLNAHRLFGVCNIMKILKQLGDEQKEEAMRSIIYESEMRHRFPVLGCSLVISQLRERIRQHEEELYCTNAWLAILRNKEQFDAGQIADLSQQFASQFQLSLSANQSDHPYDQSNIDMYLNSNPFFVGDRDVVGYGESSDVKPFWIQQQQILQQQHEVNNFYMNNLNINASLEMKPLMISQELPLQQEIEVSHDYDVHTIADDPQSNIESKDACQSSAESKMKNAIAIDTLSQNYELKSAAACFSLSKR